MRHLYQAGGIIALALGIVGIFLPLLPTVPFVILAAYLFARGNPAWERRLIAHPRLGPPILRWRERGAIGRPAKALAVAMLLASAAMGWLMLPGHWRYVPAAVAVVTASWIVTRPSH